MTASVRRKIWEIGEFQCPILGTCLTIAELRKLGRKARLAAVSLSDFTLHTAFVRKCQEKDSISIMVTKFLDRKYAKVLKKLAFLKTPQELRKAWQTAMAEGDIPGAFWGIMSHPEADKNLIQEVYAEVHMLSHLVGASNRADIRRLAQLEKQVTHLRESLSKGRALWQQQQRAAKTELREAQNNLATAWRTIRTLQTELQMQEEVRRMGGSVKLLAEVSVLREELSQVRHANSQQVAEAERLRFENSQLHRKLFEQEQALNLLDQLVEQTAGVSGAIGTGSLPGTLLTATVSECPAGNRNMEACPGQTDSRLCGKCVLYVGGRNNLVPHYRQVVESRGARFRHHDGGVECRLTLLESELGQADVVICPVDCVSHEACARVKRFCKKAAKPFVMLRSSGLSAFSRSVLQLEMGAQEPAN